MWITMTVRKPKVDALSISVTGSQLEILMSGCDKAAANHERKQDTSQSERGEQ